MKKVIIFFVSLLVMVCLLACDKPEAEESLFVDIEMQDETQAAEETQEAFEEVPEMPEIEEKETSAIVAPVFVYDDEMFTLHYIGTDTEYSPSLIFNVANKTERDIGFYFDTIAVNGETESPAFIVEVLAGTEAEYWCDVSTIEGLDKLTANICITDSDGYTIKECSIKDVPLN